MNLFCPFKKCAFKFLIFDNNLFFCCIKTGENLINDLKENLLIILQLNKFMNQQKIYSSVIEIMLRVVFAVYLISGVVQ